MINWANFARLQREHPGEDQDLRHRGEEPDRLFAEAPRDAHPHGDAHGHRRQGRARVERGVARRLEDVVREVGQQHDHRREAQLFEEEDHDEHARMGVREDVPIGREGRSPASSLELAPLADPEGHVPDQQRHGQPDDDGEPCRVGALVVRALEQEEADRAERHADVLDHLHHAEDARPVVIAARELRAHGHVRNAEAGVRGVIEEHRHREPHGEPGTLEQGGGRPERDDPQTQRNCRGREPGPPAPPPRPRLVREVAGQRVAHGVPHAGHQQDRAHQCRPEEQHVRRELEEVEPEQGVRREHGQERRAVRQDAPGRDAFLGHWGRTLARPRSGGAQFVQGSRVLVEHLRLVGE